MPESDRYDGHQCITGSHNPPSNAADLTRERAAAPNESWSVESIFGLEDEHAVGRGWFVR
jgi:hypothetical protein